jgi:(E)-4-hydroxy-3-methylbut-2-enyl-diphosphate synthase
LYEDGVRQKERLDNTDLVDALEARIRAKAAMLAQRINVKAEE